MRNPKFLIFFSIILILYASINYYILHRGLSLLEKGNPWRTFLTICIVIFAVSFIAGRFLERRMINPFSATVVWVGAFWLAFMVYILLQLILIDFVGLLDHWFRFLPSFVHANPATTRKILGIAVVAISSVVVIAGHLNTWFPKIKNLDIAIHKRAGNLKRLNIVAFSDVHLGTLIEKRHLAGIVKKVNELKPDIILIAGDIIDEDINPVIHSNVGETLKQLQAKYGVYAVTGNHEYIGGAAKAKQYLTNHGIQLLNDTAVLIDHSFYVAGREDLMKNQSGHKRKLLVEITENLQKELPLILMDHQPFRLEQAAENGVDLQLSGHTHHGQLWPFNYITNLVYEKSWGYLEKGNTHYYVSCGVGGWGPPIRTVSRPEILNINLHFD
ncbi:MAG: metallophosphoesterase [Bacteroidales bacterium]|nr:metallophosphoesterase [Bacteroidales bacterium]